MVLDASCITKEKEEEVVSSLSSSIKMEKKFLS
jgi:hypothetical protein